MTRHREHVANHKPLGAEGVGLPVRVFLYTTDQIAGLLEVSEDTLRASLFYEGRSVGARPKGKMLARNIAPEGEKPDWRIAERELLRWLRFKGFRFYERGWALI